jgi:biopolymer transport protein ExbB
MKKWILGVALSACMAFVFCGNLIAQDAPAAAAGGAEKIVVAAGEVPKTDDDGMADKMTFFNVVFGSGPLGVILWLALAASLFAFIWFVVDCAITVRADKIMSQVLVDKVTESMEQGDVLKALSNCEDEPGPMANILTAGFSHVEEGFETIQEAVGVAADLESETMMQRISWLSVCGSIAPMLGLLGTVQGMIAAFESLAIAGVAQIGSLALSIGQALYTTAAGLTVAIPAAACFYFFKNRASRIILRMEAITLELIKDLRNVEVVQEERLR